LEDFALISPGRHSFYLWLTGGLAATSLALIVFVPSLNTSLSWVKWLSVAFFIASMLFGITSHLVLRELEVFKFEGTQKTTNYHHTSLAVSLISFCLGFISLSYSMHPYLLIIFFGVLMVCLQIYKSAQTEILRHHNPDKFIKKD
jgi:hypothetical protein